MSPDWYLPCRDKYPDKVVPPNCSFNWPRLLFTKSFSCAALSFRALLTLEISSLIIAVRCLKLFSSTTTFSIPISLMTLHRIERDIERQGTSYASRNLCYSIRVTLFHPA